MSFERILVVDDEMIVRKSLEALLKKRGYEVVSAGTLEEAQEALAGKERFDLVFVDMRLPDGEGTVLLEQFREDAEAPMVVVITGYGSIEMAVDCMRNGAFDYLLKPVSQDHIEVVLQKAESFDQAVKVNKHFTEAMQDKSEILGQSGAIRKLRRMVNRVAGTGATVLITGENGTGKELVAREVYRLSPLRGKPFIKVNCAAIADTLIESEFFGHERGAFTGASERRVGRFELAHNGTILLDEIGEIPMSLQAKLLRVLQEQEFERVGGNRTMKVNVRVIATTNRNLLKAVEKGEFRQDLYYRLNVVPIVTPPLRERGDDILLLAGEFLKGFSRKNGIKADGFSPDSERLLLSHIWPGNVRELQNSIERAVILTEEGQPVEAHCLGLLAHPLASGTGLGSAGGPLQTEMAFDAPRRRRRPVTSSKPKSLADLEKEQILRVLNALEGNRTRAAEVLSISIRTLRNKLNQYRADGEAVT